MNRKNGSACGHSKWTFPFDKFIPKFIWFNKRRKTDFQLLKFNNVGNKDYEKEMTKKVQRKKQRQWNKKVIREVLLEE